MPSPFPGMNPYLENPELWPEVHHLLISIMAEVLNPQLLPKYRAAIEKRVYEIGPDKDLLIAIPDVTVTRTPAPTPKNTGNVAIASPPVKSVKVNVPVPEEIKEAYLEIREIASAKVITVIELLSPTNKRPGIGRDKYENKRQRILGTPTHLVEIDLLRDGVPMPVLDNPETSHYRILISRGNHRPTADLLLFNLQNPIPQFALPLQKGDTEPIVDLQTLLNQIYERAGYDYTIDYKNEPVPALSETEIEWKNNYLQQQGILSSS